MNTVSSDQAAYGRGLQMRIGLLGPIEVIGDDGHAVVLAGERERALLATLALAANQVVSAERLVAALWGEQPPATAANALQVQVSKLRKKLADASDRQRLVTAPRGYMLTVELGELDVECFEELARNESPDPAVRSHQLAEALGLWRGGALADVASELLEGERVRLDERRLAVLERRIETGLALGKHGALVSELEALVRAHPMREGLRGQLMIALYRSGRQSDALACFDAARKSLADDLGIDPSPELQALELAILRQDPKLGAPAPAPSEFGSPAVTQQVELDNNLPAQISSFIGRERELTEVNVVARDSRLVTLTGVGGTGKTRLALAVATGLLDVFEDGVWFVDLAPLTDPRLVTPTVASVRGVRDETDRPIRETLIDALSTRNLLLILDNCEHLLDSCAELANDILRRCPGVQVITTSREPLGITGERVFQVPPLELPADEEVDSVISEAMQLFLDRAREHSPGSLWDTNSLTAIARLCRRLDGLPLAIELACGRLRSMTVADIEARLGERFRLLTGGSRTNLPRHQTLHAVISWSDDLLTDDERAVFQRLSIFTGTFDLAMAERVAGGNSIDALQVADLIRALVDKSLIAAQPTSRGIRYRMLETVRDYAGQQLAERPRELQAARATHAAAFLALASEAVHHLEGHGQVSWLDRLDDEYDNLRAAIQYLGSDAATQRDALQLAVSLATFYKIRHRHEGAETIGALLELQHVADATDERLRVAGVNARALVEWEAVSEADVEEALALARRLGSEELVAQTLLSDAWQHYLHMRPLDMDAATDEAMKLAERIGDARTLARAMNRKSLAAAVNHRPDEARAHCHEAIRILQRSGDMSEEAVVWANLGNLELPADPDLALEYNARASALANELGDRAMQVHVNGNIALAWLIKGDDERARATTLRTLRQADRIGLRFQVAYLLLVAGILAARAEDQHGAARLIGAADGLMASMGISWDEVEAVPRDHVVESLTATMDQGLFAKVYDQGRGLAYASAIELATTLLTPQRAETGS